MAKLDKNLLKLKYKILAMLASVGVVVLLSIGGLSWWASSFISNSVHDELAAQQIYFPPLGSKALASPDIGPYLNQYAGQQLLTGPQAKAYANHFIAVHLTEVAGGKTYAQVSEASLASPNDAKLKAQAQTLFQGETLRGLLLGDAYAFGTMGQIAKIVSIVAFALAGVLALLVLVKLQYIARL